MKDKKKQSLPHLTVSCTVLQSGANVKFCNKYSIALLVANWKRYICIMVFSCTMSSSFLFEEYVAKLNKRFVCMYSQSCECVCVCVWLCMCM